MGLWFANTWGWVVANPFKAALYLFAFLGFVYVITWFACGKSKGIDIKNVEKINSDNRHERQQALREDIEANAETVKTVDGRTTIADVHVAERNQAVDEKVKEADRKIEEAKQQGQDVTSRGLECILLPEKPECQ